MEWSIITGRGGGVYKTGGGGGQVKFYTYGKGAGGAGKVLVYYFMYTLGNVLHVFISNYISYNSKKG